MTSWDVRMALRGLVAFYLLLCCMYACMWINGGALDRCAFLGNEPKCLQEDGFLLPGTREADVLEPEPGGGCGCEGDCERL